MGGKLGGYCNNPGREMMEEQWILVVPWKWKEMFGSGYIVKAEVTGFADGLYVELEEERS